MNKTLTQRQIQGLTKPCPSVAHVNAPVLCRKIGEYSTLLYVAPSAGKSKLNWCASVASKREGEQPVPLSAMSPKKLKKMEQICREMLYLEHPAGKSVGKGEITLSPGTYAVNLYREVDDDERTFLPEDWLVQPTDEQIENYGVR